MSPSDRDAEGARNVSKVPPGGKIAAESPAVAVDDGHWEDFTCVTPWEDFVRSLEDVLRGWKAYNTGTYLFQSEMSRVKTCSTSLSHIINVLPVLQLAYNRHFVDSLALTLVFHRRTPSNFGNSMVRRIETS